MSLSHLFGVLNRRWLVVVLGLLATIGAGFAASRVVPSEFSSTSTVLLLPPVNPTEPGANPNPYLSLGGLTGPTEVVARSMSDPATEQKLLDAGATGTWTVGRDFQTSAPILIVTTQDTTVEQAKATSSVVLSEVPKALDSLQASINVPSSARITSTVVSKDANISRVLKPLIRTLLLVSVGGVVLTVAVAALMDALMLHRAASRRPVQNRRRGHDLSDAPAAEAQIAGPSAPEQPASRALQVSSSRRATVPREQQAPDKPLEAPAASDTLSYSTHDVVRG